MSTDDFDPSQLGTKDHWDQRYIDELAQFYDSGLEGEVWFGDEPVTKMVDWASTHVPPSTRPSVLDVGTGNGHLLFALVDAGYDASRLTGIDYSQGSIDLSCAIAVQRQRPHHSGDDDEGEEEEKEKRDSGQERAYHQITFAVCDFLDSSSPVPAPIDAHAPEGAWDLVLDKGTYDAMSLMDKNEFGMMPLETYVPRVVGLLRPGGHFLITSCNFTEEELTQKIAPQGSPLQFKGSIPYKRFTFGGKSGSSYATVAFQKTPRVA